MPGMQAVHDGTKRDLSQVRDLRIDEWVFVTRIATKRSSEPQSLRTGCTEPLRPNRPSRYTSLYRRGADPMTINACYGLILRVRYGRIAFIS